MPDYKLHTLYISILHVTNTTMLLGHMCSLQYTSVKTPNIKFSLMTSNITNAKHALCLNRVHHYSIALE